MSIIGHLRYYGGIILVVFGVFLTFGGLVNYFDGKETLGSFVTLAFFIGVLPALTGAWMIYTAKKTGKDSYLSGLISCATPAG